MEFWGCRVIIDSASPFACPHVPQIHECCVVLIGFFLVLCRSLKSTFLSFVQVGYSLPQIDALNTVAVVSFVLSPSPRLLVLVSCKVLQLL
jgi:hypothetical protein